MLLKRNVLFFVAGILFLSSCARSGRGHALQAKIDSLQRRLDDAYRPGLGEFMSGIQVHHAKLWFAGNAQKFIERLLHLPEGSVVFRGPNGAVVSETTTLKQLRHKWEGK